MTKELQAALNREYKDAQKSGDIKRILCAIGNMCQANNDCQLKSSIRIKRIQAIIFTLLTGGGGVGVFSINWHAVFKLIFGGN